MGGFVVRELMNRGFGVRVLDDLSTGREENLPSGVDLIVGSVTDEHALRHALIDVDAVVHLAGHVSVRDSVDAAVLDANINLLGSTRTLYAAAKAGVSRFVYASSMAVYSEPLGARPLAESAPTWPLSPYGADKLAAEVHTASICKQAGMDWCVLRIFNVYGPQQRLTPSVGIVRLAIDAAFSNRVLDLFGYGLHVRDFIHVRDVASAIALALQSEHDGVFNIGTGIGTRIVDLLAIIERISGKQIESNLLPHRKEELKVAVADTAKTERMLGFRAQIELNEGIEETIMAYAQKVP